MLFGKAVEDLAANREVTPIVARFPCLNGVLTIKDEVAAIPVADLRLIGDIGAKTLPPIAPSDDLAPQKDFSDTAPAVWLPLRMLPSQTSFRLPLRVRAAYYHHLKPSSFIYYM
jgi:hypothetical protein